MVIADQSFATVAGAVPDLDRLPNSRAFPIAPCSGVLATSILEYLLENDFRIVECAYLILRAIYSVESIRWRCSPPTPTPSEVALIPGGARGAWNRPLPRHAVIAVGRRWSTKMCSAPHWPVRTMQAFPAPKQGCRVFERVLWTTFSATSLDAR